MKKTRIASIFYDLKRMFPKEIVLKNAKVTKERLCVLAQFEGHNFFVEFEGNGNVKIAKNKNGYVVYCGRWKPNPKKDMLNIVKALFGQCKAFVGVWHWCGEIYHQSVPI